jgi:signal transduction histidine kinase
MTIPVAIDVPAQRLDPAIEAPANFVIAEAMTNVAKHAGAGSAAITATIDGERRLVRLAVRDDGRGGVGVPGQGLPGLADRLAAVDGRLEIDSPAGGGTTVAAVIPLGPA